VSLRVLPGGECCGDEELLAARSGDSGSRPSTAGRSAAISGVEFAGEPTVVDLSDVEPCSSKKPP
jgi:hypothetical protein